MRYAVTFLRREICMHTRIVEAKSLEAAEDMADGILEEGDIDWDVAEVGDEWVESVFEEEPNASQD